MPPSPLTVAYVARFDPDDVSQWSGIPAYTIRAMRAAGADVRTIGPLHPPLERAFILRYRLERKLRDRYFDIQREPLMARSYARIAGGAVAASGAHIVLSHDIPSIADLPHDRPTAFWTDATFSSLIDSYEQYGTMTKRSLRLGLAQEREFLRATDLVMYASDWARTWAIDSHDLDPARVHVVGLGANVDPAPTPEDVERFLVERDDGPCRLLFFGIDWERKGGDIAFAATEELRRRGVDAELIVLGTTPPPEVGTPDWMTVLGFVSKATPEGEATIARELDRATFLLLPTRAEAFGIVFAEASAHGVPSLAPSVGGVPSAVHDGVNGVLHPADADGSAYADTIERILRDGSYSALARSSQNEFATRLNWDSAVRRALELMQQTVDRA
jgi:glycosyltransferase involved in cell wall biosynthesis